MQCKDIPDRPILEFLADPARYEQSPTGWANWCFEDEHDVTQACPDGTPSKLVLAKMRQMIRRGVVDGCPCGCRGDFVITEKGRAEISMECAKGDRP